MATMSTEVRLHGSEVHVLRSDAVGDDYEISVFPPALPVDGPVPVVYCTDANITVGIAANNVLLLQGPAEIPPVRLVCVGYPLGDDWAQFVRLRTRDCTATNDPVREAGESLLAGGMEVRGGGADAPSKNWALCLSPGLTGYRLHPLREPIMVPVIDRYALIP